MTIGKETLSYLLSGFTGGIIGGGLGLIGYKLLCERYLSQEVEKEERDSIYLEVMDNEDNKDNNDNKTLKKIKTPLKGSRQSAGWDLYSRGRDSIKPGTRKLVSTGLKLKYLPPHYYLRIAPRSGLACKGIDIGAGVVDGDYRGELKVLVINNSDETFEINNETRIAQLIPEVCGDLDLVVNGEGKSNECIRETRGEGGFGSTDR